MLGVNFEIDKRERDMQLHFTPEQLQLLADILAEQNTPAAGDLLQRVLVHDLRFDCEELDRLIALVNTLRALDVDALVQTTDTVASAPLQHKKALLDEILDRLSEAL